MGGCRISTPLRQWSQQGRDRLALSGFCPQLACDLEQLYQMTKWGMVTEGCVGEVLFVLDLVDGGLAHMCTHTYTHTHTHTLSPFGEVSPLLLSLCPAVTF